jgi:hypothetical protein
MAAPLFAGWRVFVFLFAPPSPSRNLNFNHVNHAIQDSLRAERGKKKKCSFSSIEHVILSEGTMLIFSVPAAPRSVGSWPRGCQQGDLIVGKGLQTCQHRLQSSTHLLLPKKLHCIRCIDG